MIYLLENRRNATSFRLDPYIVRCKLLNIQPLEVRRKTADAVVAFDIYKNNIIDPNISSKFVSREHHYETRRATLIDEPFYRTDYLRNQPLARLIYCINQNSEIFSNTNDKNVFKRKIEAKIEAKLSEIVND